MGIHEFNQPKREVFHSFSPLVNPLLLKSFGDHCNLQKCKGIWPLSFCPKSSPSEHHRQASGLRGKWPTREQLVLFRDPSIVSKKDLMTKSPWELQKKRKSTKAEELDRIRRQCEARRDSVKKQSQLFHQQAFDNWLKGKIKARKEEALDHLRRLKLEEDRKSLFAEYIERKNIEEVGKWLLDKMSILEEVIDAKNMNEDMRKWYEAQKESMKERLLKLWGYQFFRPLPKVDPRRCPKFGGYIDAEPKFSIKAESLKSASTMGKTEHRNVQFLTAA